MRTEWISMGYLIRCDNGYIREYYQPIEIEHGHVRLQRFKKVDDIRDATEFTEEDADEYCKYLEEEHEGHEHWVVEKE